MSKKVLSAVLVLSFALLACDASSLAVQISELSSLATPKTPAVPTTVRSATPSSTPFILTVTASDYLNLRNIPDAYGPDNSSSKATMPSGTRLTWLGECRGAWAKVDYKGLIGWANNSFMKPEVCK